MYFGYFLRLLRLVLLSAEGGWLPWGQGQGGRPDFLSICLGEGLGVRAGASAWPLPTPNTCWKLRKKPGPPYPTSWDPVHRCPLGARKDQVGGRAPKAQGFAGDHHRYWQPWLVIGARPSVGHIPLTHPWNPEDQGSLTLYPTEDELPSPTLMPRLTMT